MRRFKLPKKNWKNSLMSSFGRRKPEESSEAPNQKVVSKSTDDNTLKKLIGVLIENNNELKNTNQELKSNNKKMLDALKKHQELSEDLVKNIKNPTKTLVSMNNINNDLAPDEGSDTIFIPDLTKNVDSGKKNSISINEENSKKNKSLDEASAALKSLKKKKN